MISRCSQIIFPNRFTAGVCEASPCGHIWRLFEEIGLGDICPVCAQIKAAREEMLEVACGFMDAILEKHFRQAYQERFHEQG